MLGKRHAAIAVVAVAMLAAVWAAAQSSAGTSRADKGPVNVGIIYSRTGLLAAFGAEYIEGLKIGLAYATHGTNKVNGRKIELNISDDGGDPSKAVAAGKDLIGQGYKILAGSTSSGVALQMAPLAEQNHVLFISGPAASDAITGINRYTFRSGRQTYQDIATADAFLTGTGRKIVVFAQDTAFGNGNFAAVKAVLGGKGHVVDKILVPFSATDFTPFAQKAKQANPDLLFVAWAGTTGPAMFKALDQQGVFQTSNKVVTGLAERATWPTFAGFGSKISFLSHYVYNAPKSTVNTYLVKTMRKRSQVPDLFTPDGFTAALMIVHAIQKSGGDDVDKMISSLEGWSFQAPKGKQTIRKADHAMLQPMFQVKLKQSGKGFVPVILKRLTPGRVAPPVKK